MTDAVFMDREGIKNTVDWLINNKWIFYWASDSVADFLNRHSQFENRSVKRPYKKKAYIY